MTLGMVAGLFLDKFSLKLVSTLDPGLQICLRKIQPF